jgi:hypothetical protein
MGLGPHERDLDLHMGLSNPWRGVQGIFVPLE